MPKTPPGETRGKVLHFVRRRLLLGRPPSIREVQEEFGFRSSATARQHLDALVELGALLHDVGQDRGYRLPGVDIAGQIPILGHVQAGALNHAVETADGYVPVDARYVESCFALTVRGESMSGREIHDGDVVLVERDVPIRSGDVVVALVGEEATIKTYRKNGSTIILEAENPDYDNIIPSAQGPEFRLLGRVFEVRKRL